MKYHISQFCRFCKYHSRADAPKSAIVQVKAYLLLQDLSFYIVSLILGYQPAADSLPVQPNQEPSATEEQNNFSPGPYIIGSLVPRCFDTSRRVQSTALACLQILVSSIFKAVPKSRDPKILPIGMKIMKQVYQ